MTPGRLYVFLEGPDDDRFFQTILQPLFERRYSSVYRWSYAEQTAAKVDSFLRSVDAIGADYLFISDIDYWPCPSGKKQELAKRFKRLKSARIVVVIQEIEGWYLAGLDSDICRKMGVPLMADTDRLTKEACEGCRPSRFDARIDFLEEALKHYRIDVARAKNASLDYLFRKHLAASQR